MNYTFTNIPELDIQILLIIPDADLPNICAVNRTVNEICNSEYFWIRKLQAIGYHDLSQYEELSARDIYRFITAPKTCYILLFNNYAIVHNDIRVVYNEIIRLLSTYGGIHYSQFPPIKRAQDLIQILSNKNFWPLIELYQMIDGKEIPLGHPPSLLFSVHDIPNYNVGIDIGNGVKVKIVPNLDQYPKLGTPIDSYIYYMACLTGIDVPWEEPIQEYTLTNAFIAIRKLVPERLYDGVFDRLMELGRSGSLLYDEFEVLSPQDNMDPYHITSKFVYANINNVEIFLHAKLPLLIITRICENYQLLIVNPLMFSQLRFINTGDTVNISTLVGESLGPVLSDVINKATIVPISNLWMYPVNGMF